MAHTLSITGKNLIDEAKRKAALSKLQENVSTEALEFMAELGSKPNASTKFLSKKKLINTFF